MSVYFHRYTFLFLNGCFSVYVNARFILNFDYLD